MAHPLTNKTTNSTDETKQAEKPVIRVSPLESEEPDVGQSELPANFGEVAKGIYRSAFPQSWNLPALKVLKLRTIITLVEEPFPQNHLDFLKENDINHHCIPFIANKDVSVKTPDGVVNTILRIMLDKANHPMLIHCNKGKHRTGCVTGCFRKLQGWEKQDIVDEYIRFSRPKQRPLDEAFIEAFDPSNLSHLAQTCGAKSWDPSGTYGNIRAERDRGPPENLFQLPRNDVRVAS
ncbi:hypothetical protein ASPSYDRAFT_62318 [Aspergillus sydowii CBS 593.65]|uniref:diphosphoinositol-polyphosphate diphosphatase n=1 Tax=Aspergillus sydowii CBS 593.65 TaxID=1036612 RepID=A0A1L9T121_9EURO|nr:uncharacterized protein ASPSYDRAFT_62318 [Aspergillus sydowii CBS 593.65]OJJ53150.1 hypothetical protein ASPSYDRAFT_62318 [Aspergillus sydowii CBS 593.65]